MTYTTGFTCPSLVNSATLIDLGVIFALDTSSETSSGSMSIAAANANTYNTNGSSAMAVPATGTYQVTFKLTTSGGTDNTEVTQLIFGLSSALTVTNSSVINAIPIYAGGSNTYNAPYWYTTFIPLTVGNVYPFVVREGNNSQYTLDYQIYLNQPPQSS